jgi:holo-[acyl-carrier protein] synthase
MTPAEAGVGIDLVRVSRIAESLEHFGDRFLDRIFTPAEVAYAGSASAPSVTHERLAARFAAKEAALKAFGLVDAGVSWRELEVVREPSGACVLRLHGRARELAGQGSAALSLSHEGDLATAVVVTFHPTRHATREP